MTLDERIKQFQQRWRRVKEWDNVHSLHLRLIFDLIDDREILLSELANARMAEMERLEAKDDKS